MKRGKKQSIISFRGKNNPFSFRVCMSLADGERIGGAVFPLMYYFEVVNADFRGVG